VNDDLKSPVIAKPGNEELAAAIFFLLFCGAAITIIIKFCQSTDVSSWLAIAILILPLILLGLYLILHYATYRIMVDNVGLSWRTWRGAGWANWEDVSDYYDEESEGKKRILRSTVIADGRKIKFDQIWRKSAELKSAISLRAQKARAKEWGYFGARDEDDYPQVFVYSQRKIRNNRLLLFVFSILFFAYWCDITGSKFLRMLKELPHIPWWDCGALITMLFLLDILIVYPNALILARYNELKRRRNERITVDREKITYEDSGIVTKAQWGDVSKFYWTSDSKQTLKINDIAWIDTKNGPICFYFEIENYRRLAKIVEKYAVNASARKWLLMDRYDSLDPKEEIQKEDVKRYLFRNRNFRALSFLPTIYTIAPLIAIGSRLYFGEPIDSVIIGITFVAFLFCCYCWVVFYKSSIVIDHDKISKISIFGEKTYFGTI
jgi:hypothetical protein